MLALMLGFIGLFCFVHARRQKGVQAQVVGLVANFLGVFFMVMALLATGIEQSR